MTSLGTIKATNMGTIFLLVFPGCYDDCFDGRRDDFQLTDLGFVRFSTCEIPGFSIDLVGLCAGAVGYYAYCHRRVHDVGERGKANNRHKNQRVFCWFFGATDSDILIVNETTLK